MIKEHYEAVKALLPSTWRVYLGQVDASPKYPYVLIWGSPGTEFSETLDDQPREFRADLKITVAGQTFDSTVGMLNAARKLLNRAKPVVEGRRCGRLKVHSLMDIQPDNNITIPGSNNHPLYAVDECEIWSDRI